MSYIYFAVCVLVNVFLLFSLVRAESEFGDPAAFDAIHVEDSSRYALTPQFLYDYIVVELMQLCQNTRAYRQDIECTEELAYASILRVYNSYNLDLDRLTASQNAGYSNVSTLSQCSTFDTGTQYQFNVLHAFSWLPKDHRVITPKHRNTCKMNFVLTNRMRSQR